MMIACIGKFRLRNGSTAMIKQIDYPSGEPIRGVVNPGPNEFFGSWHGEGQWVRFSESAYDIVEKLDGPS
ncbi:hypothetical protein NKJ88_05930 [Mesorhizobium sp. M0016]|uniref:hypothetical protein n=1 Tax=Mesorhizobium sp. M0016 TaxID=2956843 RepID=UPI00333C9FBB